MSTLNSATILSPYNEMEECAHFTIDDVSTPFILHGLTTVGTIYTFSFWLKSEATKEITVNGTTFQAMTEWVKHVSTYTASGEDLRILFSSVGTYYIYHPQLEFGTIPTDWTPAFEDHVTELNELEGNLLTQNDIIASLRVDTDNISSSVTSIETSIFELSDSVTKDIQTLTEQVEAKMTSTEVDIQIKAAIDNGVDKVITSTGYTLDGDGLTVSKSDSEMSTQITEDGMRVLKNSDTVLVANGRGVDAVNLHATTYLIIGNNSRFEDWGNRTACFWIGN